jgi:DNA-binding response OmpR family regulator
MEQKKSKIVIIDDEEDFCYFVKKNLELRADFEVTICSDSLQAVSVVEKLHPDLVLLDILMPGKDGFTVLRELKANETTWNIPVVMLTAKGDTQSIFEGKKYHATDFFIKPFEMKELIKFIKKYLV